MEKKAEKLPQRPLLLTAGATFSYGQIWRGAPTLGEDTNLVLKTLCGYTDGELAALRAENLIQ